MLRDTETEAADLVDADADDEVIPTPLRSVYNYFSEQLN